LYADDAKLHFNHLDLNVVQAQVHLDLNSVAQWISSSGLLSVVNLRQRISGKMLNVSIGGSYSYSFESVRYLGVIIDSMNIVMITERFLVLFPE